MIEIAVCDDDSADLKCAVDMLYEILDDKGIEYDIKSFLSAKELLQNIQKIDIGVLDIAMEEMSGIELGRALKQKFPDMKLVYMTCYEEYCMQAINSVHAFSFLCKPLEIKAMREQMIAAVDGLSQTAIEKTFYKVTDGRNREYPSVRLRLEDILYVEYIKRQRRAVVVLNDETYECECIFENLADELEQYGFAVNCRGCLVNLCHVAKIKGFVLYLDNGRELPIAQKRCSDFRIRMNEFLQDKSFRRD